MYVGTFIPSFPWYVRTGKDFTTSDVSAAMENLIVEILDVGFVVMFCLFNLLTSGNLNKCLWFVKISEKPLQASDTSS